MCHLFVLIPFSLVCSYLCVNIAIVINSSVPKNSSSAIWFGISLYKHNFFSGIHNILHFSFQSSFLCVFLFFLVDALEQLNWDFPASPLLLMATSHLCYKEMLCECKKCFIFMHKHFYLSSVDEVVSIEAFGRF